MSRLGAQAKAQFYPTPMAVLPAVAALIDAPQGATVYDPCAGTGTFLAALAEQTGMAAYGNELDAVRAAEARERYPVVQQVTTGPMESVERDGAPFSVAWYNPPYSESTEGGRMETRGLGAVLPHLAARGLFLALVPLDVACSASFIGRLHATCDVKGVAKLPGALYEPFKQVMVWAVRRSPGQESALTVDAVMRRFDLAAARWMPSRLPDFGTEDGRPWAPPHAPVKVPGKRGAVTLANHYADTGALAALAAARGATTLPAFAELTTGGSRGRVGDFRPLLPLRRGHAAEMLAAGFLDGGEVVWEGRTYLVRGHSRRIVTERTEDTGETTYKVTRRERFATVVTLLDAITGAVTVLDMETDRARYEAFLVSQADALTTEVQRRYPAVYDPARPDLAGPALAPILRTLARVHAPGKLPGVECDGLLPAQHNAVTAVALALRTDKTAFLNGEMGTGKTLMGTALWAAIEGARMDSGRAKAVIMAPAHLAKKWTREVEVALREFGARAVIARTPSDVDAAIAAPYPCAILVTRETAKMGNEWEPAGVCVMRPDTTRSVATADGAEGEADDVTGDVTVDAADVTVDAEAAEQAARKLVPVVLCPCCGKVAELEVKDEDGEVIGYTPMRWTTTAQGRRVPVSRERVSCLSCRSPLWQQVPFKKGRKGRAGLPLPGEPVLPDPEWATMRLGTTARGLAFGGGRAALADYIAGHYARRYVLLADEVHELKGATTDQGYSFATLESACRKAVGLTGTIYGGKASTIFTLGYRMLPSFRAMFSHAAESEFVSAYGLVETVEYKNRDNGHSALGYRRRGEVKKKEIPGAQPEMIALLLPHTVFVELADLGVALPAYDEYSVVADVPADVRFTLGRIEAYGDEAAATAKAGDPSLLAGYAQLALGWPFKMEGAECVLHPKLGHTLFACDPCEVPEGGWPLDDLLARFAVSERAQGRRTLVYLQQMTKRDAAPRLEAVLRARGLNVATLRANVEGVEREAWVAAQIAAGVDVVLTNPALVATGLDLLGFPNIVHFGVDYSTYRLRQSSRRSWRLGQQHGVRVLFFSYAGTMVQDAMPLLAKKLRAAQHVDGRLAEGLAASVENDEDGDLLSALLRQVMTGRVERGPAFPEWAVPEWADIPNLAAVRAAEQGAEQGTAEDAEAVAAVLATLAAETDADADLFAPRFTAAAPVAAVAPIEAADVPVAVLMPATMPQPLAAVPTTAAKGKRAAARAQVAREQGSFLDALFAA